MIYNLDCTLGCKKYLQDDTVDLIITDPPYNLGFGGTKQTKSKQPRFSIIANDQLTHSEYQRFTFKWLHQAYRILKPGRHIYICIDWRMYPYMAIWARRAGFTIKNCIVWDKVHMGMGWQYRFRHEFILFAVKDTARVRRVKSRSATDVFSLPRIRGDKTIHPTEKPVKLMDHLIELSSEPGELIVDFFVGSGPVPVSALSNGRDFIGFEIDPVWYEVSSERIQRLLQGF
ncbi:site-specific DNA-methyltransferase [Mycobacterium gordonae]|nr:site-specific DNA-methyltransferase [Mycobacterium gordonae]